MALDEAAIERAVGAVREPELAMALADTGMVRGVRSRRHRATVDLALPVADWPAADELRRQVAAAAGSVAGVDEVEVEVSVMTEAERDGLRRRLRGAMSADGGDHDPAEGGGHGGGGHAGHGHGGGGAKPRFLEPGSKTRVVGISSGKGGVGKSSVTVNLGVALARSGATVGILDADVYGFSIPKMLGVDHDPVVLGDTVVPASAHGLRALSMGFFVPDDTPVIWRGPMLHKAIEQFLGDAWWGEPDILLVDMPPGTGDVTLSLAQVMTRAEILVVTTPQPAAQRVAQRAAYAARKLKLSVRGVVENMSWFTGDDQKRYELFGAGGGQSLSDDLGVPLLARIPLVPALRQGGDNGMPITVSEPDGEVAAIFDELARRVLDLGPARVYRRELTVR